MSHPWGWGTTEKREENSNKISEWGRKREGRRRSKIFIVLGKKKKIFCQGREGPLLERGRNIPIYPPKGGQHSLFRRKKKKKKIFNYGKGKGVKKGGKECFSGKGGRGTCGKEGGGGGSLKLVKTRGRGKRWGSSLR